MFTIRKGLTFHQGSLNVAVPIGCCLDSYVVQDNYRSNFHLRNAFGATIKIPYANAGMAKHTTNYWVYGSIGSDEGVR
jgi:hypothetical protein